MLFPKLICEVVVVSSFASWTCLMPLATSAIIVVRGGPNVPRDALGFATADDEQQGPPTTQ